LTPKQVLAAALDFARNRPVPMNSLEGFVRQVLGWREYVRPVYQWFMEMFIDAYDWVMVPNVFGMSQFADGGLIMTKPYVNSSHYLMKMSDYPAGPWCEAWDGLFWRFIQKHQDYFQKNPRLKPLVRVLTRMSQERARDLIQIAEEFLGGLK
jgi:deoxyribodipyrimidine photolyase-related protein